MLCSLRKSALAALLGLTACQLPLAPAPAVRLILSNDPCLITACPTHLLPLTTVSSGQKLFIYVLAVDDRNAEIPGYAGRVHFSSTDGLASLPPDYAFAPSDQGGKGFIAILRTPGPQTITVTDPVNNRISGTLTMTVTGQAAKDVPALSGAAKLFLALALALSGLGLARLRR